MTRDEAKKAAEIMLAYADGKEIECKHKHDSEPWQVYKELTFDWYRYYYRIKPQQKLVPFTFEDSDLFLGRAVKTKDNDWKSIITDCGRDGVYLGVYSNLVKYDNLLKEYEFLDGSPCGKIVSE